MSYETYPTMEACQAAMPARVADGNKRMKADEALLKIVGALCDTEEGFKAKLKASQQDNSI